ncbi:Conjugative transposon protein TcpC [Thermoactinomyces sp. DSM 45891]|uniref:conjugal transfer protein n=1 Tax=Thermoactinomyces sp. DSM 45891 TaxID=1761907 RepID=UPI00090F5936|nr:conjugal transfer protein [Thermoactinomyces sp. DSM 45891]SFX76183.1 Conjugative transposon protein TcpC [Thermoactinomyces sp. DSM 45891]
MRNVQDRPKPTLLKGFRQKRILLWSLLLMNAVVGCVFIYSWLVQEKGSQAFSNNPAVSMPARTKATEFANEYFRWISTDKEERAKRLEPYLIKGIDEQAGMVLSGVKVDSTPSNVQVWDVQDKGNNRANIIVSATMMLMNPSDKKFTMETRHLVVPIYAASRDSFVVEDIPYYLPESSPVQASKGDYKPQGNKVDEKQLGEYTAFLESFFKEFASTSPEKTLSHRTKGDLQLRGMGSIISFSKLESVSVWEQQSEYEITCKVKFTDHLGATFIYPYILKLTKEDGQWRIISFRNSQ